MEGLVFSAGLSDGCCTNRYDQLTLEKLLLISIIVIFERTQIPENTIISFCVFLFALYLTRSHLCFKAVFSPYTTFCPPETIATMISDHS